jgi:hypothetical protein
MPICSEPSRAVVVDELPDDGGADEGDRHRHEDQRLGDVAPPDAVRQRRDDQAEEGRQRRHDEQPQEIVEDRLAEFGIVQHPAKLLRPTNSGRSGRAGDRRTDSKTGIDEVDAEREEARESHEQPGADGIGDPQVASRPAGTRQPLGGKIVSSSQLRSEEIDGAGENAPDHRHGE